MSQNRLDQEPGVQYIWAPLRFNNPVCFIERFIQALQGKESGPLLRQKITQGAKASLAEISSGFTPEEYQKIKALLDKADLQTILPASSLTQAHTVPRPGEGVCLCVVEGEGAPTFGCLIPLIVTAKKEGKGLGPIIPQYFPEESRRAVSYAYAAVQNYLQRKGLCETGLRQLNAYDLDIRIGLSKHLPDGLSLGLPMALTLLSAILEHPIPDRIAATGDISPNGRISAVGGVSEKARAASHKGFDKIYIPTENPKIAGETDRLEMCPVHALDDVVREVFNSEILTHTIQRLNGERKTGSSDVDLSTLLMEKKHRVLISIVGRRDPFPSDETTGMKKFIEGAALTAFRSIQPEAILLFSSEEMAKQGAETKRILERLGADVTSKTLKVKDPTHYDGLVDHMAPLVNDFIANLSFPKNKTRFFLSISSGTPQMHAVWLHLIQTGILPATVIQVREPRHVTPPEDRVCLVRSRYLGI